jgi:hypothetical protein
MGCELAIAKSGIGSISVGNIDTACGSLVIATAILDIGDSISKNAKETSFER